MAKWVFTSSLLALVRMLKAPPVSDEISEWYGSPGREVLAWPIVFDCGVPTGLVDGSGGGGFFTDGFLEASGGGGGSIDFGFLSIPFRLGPFTPDLISAEGNLLCASPLLDGGGGGGENSSSGESGEMSLGPWLVDDFRRASTSWRTLTLFWGGGGGRLSLILRSTVPLRLNSPLFLTLPFKLLLLWLTDAFLLL